MVRVSATSNSVSEGSKKPVIAIAGAGAIGCFVGGMMALGQKDVRFLARPRIATMLLKHGLRITDFSGFDNRIAPAALKLSTDPSVFAEADIILVTVKSGATQQIAESIAEHAPNTAVVVSLQNGVSNADTLRAALPGRDVRAGMVAYNVINAGDGRFHRGVSGKIVVEAGEGEIGKTIAAPHLDVFESSDMRAVQWGKLLINLNNALNALSGRPLRDQVLDRDWRRIFAAQISEAMAALSAEGIEPRSATPLPTKWLPAIMRLPTPLYKIIAARNLKIDPEARSSMWEDLQAGRKTEIDELQGAVIKLCEKHGLTAPTCSRVMALIKECETRAGGSPKLSPAEVRGGLDSTR
ncbi:MAG: 2-dehydropantoate 2-reductase [Marinicaulis sp.]|nr:2-dehydropantoate 2-reductase [Marinicaulis sp.]